MTVMTTRRSPNTAQYQTRSRLRFTTLAAACLLLTACTTVGPDYQKPLVDSGEGWSLPLANASGQASLGNWWSELNDPVLDRLIATALTQNLNLKQAADKIAEARAMRDRVAGERLPVAELSASVNRQQQSKNGPLPINSMPGLNTTQTIYDAGFDTAWEVDLFGAKQRALEGAQARLQATEAEAQGVRIRIIAEVARAWFTAVGTEHELRAQASTLDTLKQTLELTRLRHTQGDVSVADVNVAYAQWANAKAVLPDIQARQRAAMLSLGILLGSPPERELSLLSGQMGSLTLRTLPIGERADILRRRPDVQAAERHLAASTADIGVATAELFPKLSIGIDGGFQALNTANWFNASSSRFSILPLVSWRLFEGGRVRAEIRAREAAAHQAALAYEQAVLTALGDAERTLSDYYAGLASLERLAAALDALHTSYERNRTRYAAGDITLIELLIVQRNLHDAEKTVAHARLNAAVQMVALYKALGGGWDAPAESPLTPHPGEKQVASLPVTSVKP